MHTSTFTCQNVNLDEDEVIFKYDLANTIGRPALFSLAESAKNVLMEQITTETERNEEIEKGLLDTTLFTNQFYDNIFSSCHHFYKGSIYYLE